jgi:hypothetical protein
VRYVINEYEYVEILKLVMQIMEESYLLLKKEDCKRNCGTQLKAIRDSALKIEFIMKGSG